MYTVPGTGRLSKRTGRKIRGSVKKYRASAPGEPPAVRTGTLRRSWSMEATIDSSWGNHRSAIYTDVPYAEKLEEGAGHMDARPYAERIVEIARPKIVRLFSRLI